MDVVKNKNGKLLRCGYTTGSCAAAAAKAAADALLCGREITRVSIGTPKGITLTLEVAERRRGADFVACAVKKTAGTTRTVRTAYGWLQRCASVHTELRLTAVKAWGG